MVAWAQWIHQRIRAWGWPKIAAFAEVVTAACVALATLPSQSLAQGMALSNRYDIQTPGVSLVSLRSDVGKSPSPSPWT
jgi:hypothetical protein